MLQEKNGDAFWNKHFATICHPSLQNKSITFPTQMETWITQMTCKFETITQLIRYHIGAGPFAEHLNEAKSGGVWWDSTHYPWVQNYTEPIPRNNGTVKMVLFIRRTQGNEMILQVDVYYFVNTHTDISFG
jgi:hypothetical protein